MAIAQNGSPVVGGLGEGGGNTTTLASRTFPANTLILCWIAMRNEAITINSVVLNGNSFTQVVDVDNTQGQGGISLWRAMIGSEQTGQITITHTNNLHPVSSVAQCFDGIDTGGSNGSAAVEAQANDPGPAVDNANAKVNVTTVTADAWVVAGLWHRGVVFTTPAGETTISINNEYGTGGDRTRCSAWYEGPIASPSTVTIGADADLASAN